MFFIYRNCVFLGICGFQFRCHRSNWLFSTSERAEKRGSSPCSDFTFSVLGVLEDLEGVPEVRKRAGLIPVFLICYVF